MPLYVISHFSPPPWSCYIFTIDKKATIIDDDDPSFSDLLTSSSHGNSNQDEEGEEVANEDDDLEEYNPDVITDIDKRNDRSHETQNNEAEDAWLLCVYEGYYDIENISSSEYGGTNNNVEGGKLYI